MTTALTCFEPATAAWFEDTVGKPTPVQEEGWPAIAAGGHVLISAPTGTGKTLCAFLVFIDRLKHLAREGQLERELHVIYISPLKSLSNDIRENLRRPLESIEGAGLVAAVRTGDTTQSERRGMLRQPPHILITTPESLYLLLTSKGGREMLRTAKAIIIDELHAMINSKRGAHLMLSLARLDALCGQNLQRIGLSATIQPLERAADYLASPDPVSIIAPAMKKAVRLEVTSPLKDMRILPEGTIWPELARSVYEYCQKARTVIAFLEGRAQAEKLAHGVNLIAGEGFARTHHGCVSKEQRLEAERQLRGGELRLLCATSSMELGIDVGEVDLVLQVGFARTISSTMQRLGRAGHNPGRTSVMHMFPRTAAEGVYCGLTARVALDGGIEDAKPPRKCLDVLAQHLVSMAAVDGYTVEAANALLRRAYCFQQVTPEEVSDVLRMLAGDYEHQLDKPSRPRILYDRIHGRVQGDAYTRMLALSAGGTIPDRGFFAVRLKDGTKLGELDEEFVFEARVGDKFLLGAFAWRIVEFRQDSIAVEPANVEGAQSPFWRGDWSGRPMQTGLAFGAQLRRLGEAHAAGKLYDALRALSLDDAAANNAGDFLVRQIKATGCLPDDRTIIVEHFQDQAGEHQVMVHSVFGGQVNVGLSLLLREVIHRTVGMEVHCFEDDDGFMLHPFGSDQPVPEGMFYRLDPDQARPLLAALLPATPLFNVAFRHNAGRALMMGARRGKRLPLWVQRLRGAQVLDGAVVHEDHPLILETRRECLEDYWDIAGIEQVLRGISAGAVTVREMRTEEPSPMALPLRRAVEATMMYEYFPTPSNVQRAVDRALAGGAGPEKGIAPAPEQLQRVGQRLRQPQDVQQLHSLLMAEGDLVAGEVDVPAQWLEELAREGRAAYIEPGLWICLEQRDLYADALERGEEAARLRIARRCLRYRGAQSVEGLADRYFWPEELSRSLLEALVDEGAAVYERGAYYHAELYGRAQRETVAMRRRQVQTLPRDRYAALLSQRVRLNASTAEQMEHAVTSLLEQPFAPSLWESVLLPARVAGYRAQMLDELLSRGAYFWQMEDGDRPMLRFHRYEEIDWDSDILALAARLAEDEQRIVDALGKRGASFAQSLGGVLGGESPVETLLNLMARGLARADQFVPVRQWLDRERQESPARRARARAITSLAGRWELTRPLREQTMEDRLERAFDRAILLCRETAQGIPWPAALETLRVWEYTGRVRRGYFVQGLSGAQFIREKDAQTAVLAMREPLEETIWLNAMDPAQPWGKSLPHGEEASFTCVPGTVVALRRGVPVAVVERGGQGLRVFEPEHLQEAMLAFARDYSQGRIFPLRPHITIKQYPKEAASALEDSGFSRQMLEYELWRQRI